MLRSLIMVPTFNESENVAPLVIGIFNYHPEAHILFVDDASPDGTQDKIRELQLVFAGRISLLARAGKQGLGTAYIKAMNWGLDEGFQYLIEMDADLSHDPAFLPAMLQKLEQNAVVIGSRYVLGGGTKNWGILRKIVSRFGSWYARSILGMSVRDLTGGFNGWNAEVLRNIRLDEVRSEGYSFQIELKYRAFLAGFSLCEFPIIFADRRVGKSKMSARIIFEAMWRIWGLKWNRPELEKNEAALIGRCNS